MSNLNTHFKKITSEKFFKQRMGNIKQGKKSIGPVFEAAVKVENLAKAQKKEKSKITAKAGE
jgi:hypothetical protein